MLGALVVGSGLIFVTAGSAVATTAVVSTEPELRSALADSATTTVTLGNSIDLTDCTPSGGDLDRNGALVLDGTGFTLRQTCAGERVLESTSGTLTLQHITITGGDLYDADIALGGGIRAAGDLTLVDATVAANRVTTDLVSPSVSFAGGGGVAGDGVIDLTNSHVDDNAVVGKRVAWGGGVHSTHSDAVNITDSTVDANAISCATDIGLAFCGGGGVSTLPIDVIGGPPVPHGNGHVALTRASVSGNTTTVTADSSDTHAWAMGGGVHSVTFDATDSHVDANSLAVDAEYDTNSHGGGVVANDDVTLVRSTVDRNSVTSTGLTFVSAHSGGLSMDGDLTATDSSISHNSVRALSDGSGAQMGGAGAYRADLTRVTMEGNLVEGGKNAAAGGLSAYIASVSSSTISDNVARSTSADGVAYAGGGSVQSGRIEASTISGNTATAPSFAHAGALLHHAQASVYPPLPDPMLTVVNSTIVGNAADSEAQPSIGGGIEEVSAHSAVVQFSTVSGNAADVGANLAVGPAFNNEPTGGTFAVAASVFADPQSGGANCDGFSVSGSDFVSVTDDSCGIDAGGDPQLGALADNGGPTMTMLPSATSPLLDRVPTDACLALVTVDQRDVTRPQGNACDVGAVERDVAPPAPPSPAPPSPAADPATDPTAPPPSTPPPSADGPIAAPAVVAEPRFTG